MDNRKSILFFLFNFNKGGGAEWVVTNIANEMVKSNLQVTVFVVKNGSMITELDEKINVIEGGGDFSSSFLKLLKILSSNKFNTVFTTQRVASVFTYLAKIISRTKTKHVVREAASNFNFAFKNLNFIQKLIWKNLYKKTYRSAYRVIVNTHKTKEDLIQTEIISPTSTPVFQIFNPLDLLKIESRSQIEDGNNFNYGEINLVSIGRLVEKKNMDVLIRAFALIRDEYLNSKLIIIGDGPERKKLENIIQELNLQDQVILAGHQDNPYSVLQKANLFVLASKWEGFGMVIVEALALGVPVVASDIACGPRPILENGKFGILVEPNSIEELAKGIKRSLESHHDRSMLKSRSLDFSMEIITKEYMNVLFN